MKCAVRFFAAENNKLKIMKKKFILTVAFLSISLFAQPKWSFKDGIGKFAEWVNEQEIQEDRYESSIEEMKQKGLYK